jgi:hypothetical protein
MTEKKKKERKRPLDMTSDEMAEYLFPKKVVDHLKAVAQGEKPLPKGKDKKPEGEGAVSQEE